MERPNAQLANAVGGNVVRRDLGEEVMQDITKYTKMSIEFALKSPDEALEFTKAWVEVLTMTPTRNLLACTLMTAPLTIVTRVEHPFAASSRSQGIGLIREDFDTDGMIHQCPRLTHVGYRPQTSRSANLVSGSAPPERHLPWRY